MSEARVSRVSSSGLVVGESKGMTWANLDGESIVVVTPSCRATPMGPSELPHRVRRTPNIIPDGVGDFNYKKGRTVK